MPSKTRSILLGAAVYVAATIVIQLVGRGVGADGMLMVGVIGCLVMVALGAVPPWHYATTNQLSIPAGTGAGMGALAIGLGALLMALVTWVMVETGMVPNPQDLALDQLEDQGLPPDQIELMSRLAHPLISGALGTLLGAIVGAIGGAIGASVFRRGGDRPPPDQLDPFGS